MEYCLTEAKFQYRSSMTTEIMEHTICTNASQKMWDVSFVEVHHGELWTEHKV